MSTASIIGDFDVFNVEITSRENLQELSVSVDTLSILSVLNFVKPSSSLRMQFIEVVVPTICRSLSCLKFESLIKMASVCGWIEVAISPVSMIKSSR